MQSNGIEGVRHPNPRFHNISSRLLFKLYLLGNKMKQSIRFVILIMLLFASSSAVSLAADCIDVISAGSQYEHCTTLKDDCYFVLPLTRYGNKSETVRKNVRLACGGVQPTVPTQLTPPGWKRDWRVTDCNNLKPLYRTAVPTILATSTQSAVTYTLSYKRYVWDSCHLVPPLTWGSRP
jgi:hypothetical protein